MGTISGHHWHPYRDPRSGPAATNHEAPTPGSPPLQAANDESTLQYREWLQQGQQKVCGEASSQEEPEEEAPETDPTVELQVDYF